MTSVFDSTPPSFSLDELARVAADLFGVSGTAHPLVSERDQNARIEIGRAHV